jgi:hypothetical protein
VTQKTQYIPISSSHTTVYTSKWKNIKNSVCLKPFVRCEELDLVLELMSMYGTGSARSRPARILHLIHIHKSVLDSRILWILLGQKSAVRCFFFVIVCFVFRTYSLTSSTSRSTLKSNPIKLTNKK